MRIHRIQDTVHGLMEFEGRGAVIIDLLRTPQLQRLRRIRQLGLAHLVFPGAEHSRLVHSLGAAYLALRFGGRLHGAARDYLVDMLTPTEADVRDLAIAALCHDLGHGPLSHAWEREIVGENYKRDQWSQKLGVTLGVGDERIKWHELVGQSFLLSDDSELHRLLEDLETGFSGRIARMLRGRHHLYYLPKLLSSDIDVDRADFILRDSYQCGVTYGKYDLPWLLSACTVGQTDGGEYVIGFDQRKSVRGVEEFLLARRSLYETVYYHRAVRSAEGLFALFLRRLKTLAAEGQQFAVFDFIQPLVDMIAGQALSPRDLLRMDDFALWVLVEKVSTDSKDEIIRDLGARILSRNLFKLVRCTPDEVVNFLTSADAHQRIYDVLKKTYGRGNEYYLIVDRTHFELFSERSREESFFVDQARRATKVRDHEAFKQLTVSSGILHRLFVPRESREAVERLRALLARLNAARP